MASTSSGDVPIMNSPEVCVLVTDGSNCDDEMAYGFEVNGGNPKKVHINELRERDYSLSEFQILGIPGGFTNGDDIASGRVLENELTSFFKDQLQEFVDAGKPTFGVCNGFQVLLKSGLLPYGLVGDQSLTLSLNSSGSFNCRWVSLSVPESVCAFVNAEDFEGIAIPMQTAHAEGRVEGPDLSIAELDERGQIVFRYAHKDLRPATDYPENPNGSIDNIAAICDPSGLILGMMPHPERSIETFPPDRSLRGVASYAGNLIFERIVNYAKES